jgi:hypothetical protein
MPTDPKPRRYHVGAVNGTGMIYKEATRKDAETRKKALEASCPGVEFYLDGPADEVDPWQDEIVQGLKETQEHLHADKNCADMQVLERLHALPIVKKMAHAADVASMIGFIPVDMVICAYIQAGMKLAKVEMERDQLEKMANAKP